MNCKSWKGIAYRSGELDEYARERCRLDIYGPEDSSVRWPVVVWFYGGGMTAGNRYLPPALMRQDMVVVAPDYRLSPVVNVPAYIEDAAASVAWTFRHCADYGGDAQQIFVAGASAGAFLAALIVMDPRWLGRYDINANKISGLISITGQMMTHFTIRAERGLPEYRAIIDEWAPLHYVRADAPPVLLTTGDRDLELPGRWEENALFLKLMQSAGHKDINLCELKQADHGAVEYRSHPLLISFVRRITSQS